MLIFWIITGSVLGILLVLFIALGATIVKSGKRYAHRFALALGAPERMASALGDVDGPFLYLDAWRKSEHPQLIACLEDLGIDFERDQRLEGAYLRLTLRSIWSLGEMNILRQRPDLAQTYHVKDILAYDAARFVELTRIAFVLKLLSEEEVWGLLFLNAQRVQMLFSSWRDYTDCYVRGRTLVLEHYNQDVDEKLLEGLEKAHAQKTHTFNEVAWRERRIMADRSFLES